jgi:hypothetical protein
MRWTWVVVGGVATLLFVAGVDALRSSADSEISAPTASTATTKIPTGRLPRCTPGDLRVSIEILVGVAAVVTRNIGANSCYPLLEDWRLAIEDRAGNLVADWPAVRPPLLDGLFPSGSEKSFWLPQDPVLCVSPGPYVALVTVGPYSARLGNLSRREIACSFLGARRPKAEYIFRADAICTAATARFQAEVDSIGGPQFVFETRWSEAAARISEEALADLRALRPPKADRARVNTIYSLMERRTDVLRQVASARDVRRVHMLWEKSIRLTHQKDALVYRLAALWGAPPDALFGCPMSLPA